MPQTSTLLSLPYIQPAQAQKHVTHNEALRVLDATVQLSVEALDTATPPAPPTVGQRFIVGTGATDAWAGQDGAVAVYEESAWMFYPPQEGWIAYVRSQGAFAQFDGSDWSLVAGDVTPQMLGVNTSADATNRLSVAAPATLLTHEGDDHRLTVNKAALADTASLLFQNNFSGRAEMGLAGEDAFSIKVSADGAAWTTAMRFDPTTGRATGQAVQQSAGDTTSGRLVLAQNAVLRDQLVGVASQSGGVPTGAVIERGTNAMGDYVKWADGTMICTRKVTIDTSTIANQPFDYAMPMVTHLTASASGANVAEMDSTLRAGGAVRRKIVGELGIWADTTGWHVKLHQAADPDTVEVNLMAYGLWF